MKKLLPQPKSERRARLQVIMPANQGGPAQDCGVCKIQSNCWMPNIKEEHVITNLLVCRLKRNIDVNRSAKLFLEMIRPKLRTLAKHAIRGTSIDIGVALSDLESQTIEYVQHYYVMGEIAYPLHYLFGQPNGVMGHFANNYARKTRRYEDTHVLELDSPRWSEKHENVPDTSEEDEAETETTRQARLVVDDGITLNLQEYRVLSFCLRNAVEAKRPLNGLHVFLARTMGLARARITKLYADACKKLVEEVRGEA